MKSIIAPNPDDKDNVKKILEKKVPSYRQAYSDRTAWIMACLSELAYIRFNPLFPEGKGEQYLVETTEKLISKNNKTSLLKLIDTFCYDDKRELEQLKSELRHLNLEIVEAFDKDGTQAVLVKGNKFIALAFRGTEKNSIKDIKTDLDAVQTPSENGGNVHKGFKKAFEIILSEITDRLKSEGLSQLPLFLTGHSLGGALATVAAKNIKHEGGLAACYTFGSPRVGDLEWSVGIKTPIYRVVNSVDVVTMLPFSGFFMYLVSFIPLIGKYIESKFGGYHHSGDMRYLTSYPKGDYGNVKLLNNMSLGLRIKRYLGESKPWKKFINDHSMAIYRRKLMIIAIRRN